MVSTPVSEGPIVLSLQLDLALVVYAWRPHPASQVQVKPPASSVPWPEQQAVASGVAVQSI